MNTTVKTSSNDGITFAVAEVETANLPLPSTKTKGAVEFFLRSSLEAVSDYTDDCLLNVVGNPLIQAAKLCYAQHRPLVLSPDVIWLTLCQGLAIHIDENWDQFKSKVLIDGLSPQKLIPVSTQEFPFGSPESPWDELVGEVSEVVRQGIHPEFAEMYQQSFSTGGKAQQAALDITFLSAVQKSFQLIRDYYICGIPSITIRGEVSDWQRLRHGIELFDSFDLKWWTEKLRPILDQFVSAASGVVDLGFWSRLYVEEVGECKIDEVTGWINDLFPYRQDNEKYRIRDARLSPMRVFDYPVGIKKISLQSERGSTVNVFGGLLGIRQDMDKFQLEPKSGWAVQRIDKLQIVMERLKSSEHSYGCPGLDSRSHFSHLSHMLCPNLSRFYRWFAGCRFFDDNRKELAKLIDVFHYAPVKPLKDVVQIGTLASGESIGMMDLGVHRRPHVAYVLVSEPERSKGLVGFLTTDFSSLLEGLLDSAEKAVPFNELMPVKSFVAATDLESLRNLAKGERSTLG